MQIFAKGEIIPQAIGGQTGIWWNMDKNGATMFLQLPRSLINRFHLGGHYDFACVPLSDVLFFCVKIGNEGWMSAPYSPHLGEPFTPVTYVSGMGMPLTVLLVCTDNGKIEDMDMIGLGNKFSNQISCLIEEMLTRDFDRNEYVRAVNQVYQRFSTDEELAALAESRYSID